MDDNQQGIQVLLTHSSGLKFQINLSNYEYEKCQQDENFRNELSNKYYSMYRNGLIFGANPEENVGPEDSFEDKDLQWNNNELTSESTLDEEQFIGLIQERRPLYDFKLPLLERTKTIVKQLWEEIQVELRVNMTVEELAKKWKNLRDRARANIKKKIASGSSAAQKIEAERIRKRHKHYDLLTFLDDPSSSRPTTTNLEENELLTPCSSRTSSRGSQRNKSVNEAGLTPADTAFLETLKEIGTERDQTSKTDVSATQHFCLLVADSLERLPRRIRNQIEIEILQKIAEAEEQVQQD